MRWRVDYGNGQVGNTHDSKAHAQRELAMLKEWSRKHNQSASGLRLSFQDPDTGDWFIARDQSTERKAPRESKRKRVQQIGKRVV